MKTELEQSELHDRLLVLHSGVSGLRSQLPVTATPDAQDSDTLHLRASDETLDRYQETISAAGWRLDNYLRNPIIQNAHQYGDIIFTIGRAEKTWINNDQLLQTWKFATAENPFAKIARDLYRSGFLHAASVGFVPLRWENGTDKTAYRRKFLEQELLEVSAVSIPANPNALTLALNAGAVQKSDILELNQLLNHLIQVGRQYGVPPGTSRSDRGSGGPNPDPSRSSRPSVNNPANPVNPVQDSALRVTHPDQIGVPQSALIQLASDLRNLCKQF